MALNSTQVNSARLIYQAGLHAGLAPNRALELVAASYAESGLNPRSTNRSSGAAGLFQLLSSGYVRKAQAQGGVYNPQANIAAILPDYVSYWRSHPQAAPGEAASAVERSGMGPSFYAGPLRIVGGIQGLPHGATTGVQGGQPRFPAPMLGQPSLQDVSGGDTGNPNYAQAQLDFAHTIIDSLQRTREGHDSADIPGLLGQFQQFQQTIDSMRRRAPVQSALGSQPGAALGGLPLTSPSGAASGAYGGAPRGQPSGRLDSRLVGLAHRYGLKITSGYRSPAQNKAVGGVPDSYHLRGEAIDVLPTDKSKQFYRYALQHPGLFTELFYDPAGLFIKNGKVYKGAIGGHSDHIHIVLAGTG